MVGVAGRSKGCFTCRSRRVKCDEGRPECQRCKKAGRICGGYREIDFIDGLPSAVRKEADKMRNESYATNSILDSASESSSFSSEDSTLSRQSSKTPFSDISDEAMPVATKRRLELMDLPDLPLSPSLLPFEDLIYLSYTQTHLMRGGHSLGSTNVGFPSGPGAMLAESSILSLSTVFFGVQHHQESTRQCGMQRYGATLKDLNLALADPDLSRDLGVMKAIMILGIYEFLLPTSQLGWMEHFLGLERLIVHRGPEAHCMPHARNLFETVRPIIIFACLVLDKPSRLAHPDWKTIPWILEPESKKPLQYLYDILADIPFVFKERERIVDNSLEYSNVATDCSILIDQIDAMVAQLNMWYQKWWADHEMDLFEIDDLGSLEAEDDTPLLWETTLQFVSLQVAHEYCVHNGVKIMLNTLLRSMKIMDPDKNLDVLSDLAEKARKASIEICRCVDYHLLDYQVGAGSLFLLFPMRMAWQGLGGNSSREGRWLVDVSKQISKGQKGWWESASDILNEQLNNRGTNNELTNGIISLDD